MFNYFVFADPPGKKLLVQVVDRLKNIRMILELNVVSVYCNTYISNVLSFLTFIFTKIRSKEDEEHFALFFPVFDEILLKYKINQ